jgi:hypothetical protein
VRQPIRAIELVDRVLDCDDRTRRARSLLLTMAFCAVLVLAAVITPLVLALGAYGAVGGITATALSGLLVRRSIRRRRQQK